MRKQETIQICLCAVYQTDGPEPQSASHEGVAVSPGVGFPIPKIDPVLLESLALQDIRKCAEEIPPELQEVTANILKNLDFLEGKAENGGRQENTVNEQPVVLSQVENDEPTLENEVINDMRAAIQLPSVAEAILQFSTSSYFCTEGEEQEMVLDVMRLGDASNACSCFYETKDLSAKAGKKYEASSGQIRFEPNQVLKPIHISIMDDDKWDATLEFAVQLSKPEGCTLGKYLHKCRVKILDDDDFPSNRFREKIRKNVAEHRHQEADFPLILEYFKMNYLDPVVRSASIKLLTYGQVGNLYFILQLIVSKHLIDKVLQRLVLGDTDNDCVPVLWIFECPDDNSQGQVLLVILMIVFIIPQAFAHYFDYRRMFWKIGGASRKILQANLLRKFLNYNEESRNSLQMSDLLMAMNRDSFDLVHNGFMQIFPLYWNFTRLVLIVCLQLVIGTYEAIIPVVVYPVILGVWLRVRSKITRQSFEARNHAQNDMILHVESTARNYHMIVDYAMKGDAVDTFEKEINCFNVNNAMTGGVNVNNIIVASWLYVLFAGVWFVVGGTIVLNGGPMGDFLINLGIFKAVGACWSTIYKIMLLKQAALVPLARVTTLLNLPTDLPERKKLNRRRRHHGEEMRRASRLQLAEEMQTKVSTSNNTAGAHTEYAADRVPIEIINVSYQYSFQDLQQASLENLCATFEQGSLVALVGLPGKGKTTVAKILGSVLFASSGFVAVPPHLRVLHISQQPVFFEDTMLRNLCYGASESDAARHRVLAICKRLGLPKHLHALIHEDETVDLVMNWEEALSITQRAQLNLARALINNPEVLVLHKPAMYFDANLAAKCFKTLRSFCHEKGLEQDPEGWQSRRPRTCVLTTSTLDGLAADKVYEVRQTSMIEVNADQIDHLPMRKFTESNFNQ